MNEEQKLELKCINTIRTLSMDAVQEANSGHPGTAMAMAPLVYYLWNRLLRFNPSDPIWPNRDRFVLSIGPHSEKNQIKARGRPVFLYGEMIPNFFFIF